MSGPRKTKEANPLHQVVWKRKREAETQDDVCDLAEPLKKRFIKTAVLDLSLHPRPSTSAATRADYKTIVEKRKKKRKAETQDDVRDLEEPLKKRFSKTAALDLSLHPRPSTSAATRADYKMIARKRKSEAALQEKLQKLKPRLEERYIVNTAVLPEFSPRPASFAATATAPGTSSTSESLMEQPIMIHGLSVPEFQRIYHSVVDQKLVKSTGEPHRYTLERGRRIKQRLWEALNCPSLIEKEQQIHYTERFSTPTLKSFAPCFELDTSQEPKPQQPKRKKTQMKAEEIVQKRKKKREAEPQDDVRELEEPLKKHFIKNAALDLNLHPRPSASAATRTDDKTIVEKRKKRRKAETQDDVRDLEEPLEKRFSKTAALDLSLHPRPSTSAATRADYKMIARKRKSEAALQEKLQKLKPRLEERYIVNTAVLPEFSPRPASFAATATAPGTSSTSESLMEQPIMIHGLSVPEFQRIYHSVVDQKLVKSTGEPRRYTLERGRRIKQRLWEALNCPSLIEKEQQIHYTERFSTPTLKSFAPCFELDTS